MWESPTEGLGTPGIAQLKHVAFVGLGFASADDPNYAAQMPWIVWGRYVNHFNEDIPLVLPAGFIDSLFWHMDPGVTMQIQVFW